MPSQGGMAGRLLLGVAASAALWANDRPVVTLTGPGQGSTFQAPATITFTATASDRDGTVKEVRFLANGVKLASDYGAPYAWNWSGVPAGTYVLEA